MLTWILAWLFGMKPSFLNLFMKKLTRGRVVPIISARHLLRYFGKNL